MKSKKNRPRCFPGVFSRYVAPQVVGKILEEGEDALQLGGTRREVTVIFVDIRGFTPLSEKAAPEEVVEILRDSNGDGSFCFACKLMV